MGTQKFENNLFQLVVKTLNGESLFDVETVARSLGFTQTKNGKEYIRWETVNKYLRKYLSQEVGKNDFISEPMVYKLAFKANNTLAEKFQDWLATEVLPTIRKTGSYMNVPRSFAEALRLAADLEEEKMMLEQKVAEYEPKITYLDTILASKDAVTTSQIAADYGMSAIQLNKILHQLGVQRKVSGQWLLYKKHMNCGYTKSHTSEILQTDGTKKIVMSTKWTQKGRLFIYNLLKDEGYYPQMDLWETA
ncbi:phage antirepressor KilAC domain-containing protein [Enterococcus casseliflavus]|uniref:phage antirepressor KilAC domain-containing protein n=1 Tax=Enterococcus casseliflavus TaxID=37734 RepID=UPI002DBABB06|nr:phage antirepressor KilAC domain-containing protein [Enterococcus casseliflavus]MEB8416328.1 phage antirepressor KilAC domain-containing protein [Enterococcus casseliflavus]